jgi:Mannosyl-glycoprotein endo-beta-N-acetylglucosaminidase
MRMTRWGTAWKAGVSVAAVMVSLAAAATAAEAARKRAAPVNRGPETPEIRLTGENTMPKCISPERLTAFLTAQNDKLEPKFQTIASEYKRHGEALKIRWDFAFYQMLLETNYLKFRRGDGNPGDVKPRQNNFAGIGATGGGVPGDSYPDVSTGVLAQMQHLVAYSGERVDNPVAPRTREVQDGIIAQSKRLGRAVRFGDLTRRWAADSNYARSIVSVAERFTSAHCNGPDPVETPVASMASPKTLASAAPFPPREAKASRGADLARKAAESDATRAALGAASGAAARPAVAENPGCQVMSASYGGAVTLLIRAETPKGVTLTALDVEGGNEQGQAQSYITSHAPGGKVTGRFKNRTEAVTHAYSLCDSGRP